jgi:hypothetical protein
MAKVLFEVPEVVLDLDEGERGVAMMEHLTDAIDHGDQGILLADLDGQLPEALLDAMDIVLEDDGEAKQVNLSSILDALSLVEHDPVPVFKLLLKVRHGVGNLAYSLEEYFKKTEDEFRIWRSEQEALYAQKDNPENPLVKKGSKITGKSIDAEVRTQPEYEKYKAEIAETETRKNMLWTARGTVDKAIEIARLMVGNQASIYEASRKLQEDGGDIEEVADQGGFHLK